MQIIKWNITIEIILTVVLLIFSFNVIAQVQISDEHPSFKMRNSFQYASYKPPKAKNGKDGSERLFVIQLIKGPKSGKAGKDGFNAPDLNVFISALQSGDSTLLQIQIFRPNKIVDTFYLNPRLGELKIAADGGDGGLGGKGESGGGTDGSNGGGGNGGKIEVVFSKEASAFVNCNCLIYSNEGGMGAYNGYNDDHQGPQGKKGPPIYIKDEKGKILLVK